MTYSSRRAGACLGSRRPAIECGRSRSAHQDFTKKLGEQYEKEMVLHRSAGNPGNAADCCHWRRNCSAPMELVVAPAVRMAADHLLASAWTSDAVPNPVRRLALAQPRPLQPPPSHGTAVESEDAGR